MIEFMKRGLSVEMERDDHLEESARETKKARFHFVAQCSEIQQSQL